MKETGKEQKHTIVLVDDDANILKAWSRSLKQWYQVAAFSSGNQLLEELDFLSPSLFVLDWLMPEMNGLDLCREIRRHHRLDPVPITFFTGVEPSLENVEAAAAAGAQSFISKTTSPAFTSLQIRTMVEHHERLARYLKDRNMVLSVLKHEISNLLTGVATGVEVMMMNPAWREAGSSFESHTIIEAARELRALFQDLTEVIAFYSEKPPTAARSEQMETILKDVRGYLERVGRQVTMPGGTGSVFCRRRSLGRAIYYLIRFIDNHLPAGIPIFLRTGAEADGWRISVGAGGAFRKEWEQAFSGENLAESSDFARHDLLFVEYAKNVIRLHHAQVKVIETTAGTEILVSIPFPRDLAQKPGPPD